MMMPRVPYGSPSCQVQDPSRMECLPATVFKGNAGRSPGQEDLLRTADSVGCTALICCGDAGTDVYNPNAIRASQGALFTVPLAVASAEAARDWLEARGVTIFAAAPAAEKIYWDCDFRAPAAILVGAEATGLTDFWLGENAARDARIVPAAIPQRGAADSLNVATAAAIFLFEALRQRSRR